MSAPPSTSSQNRFTPRQAWGSGSAYYHWWITSALMLGFMTAGLSITVVNLAFPKIMTALRADLDDMQWVQTGYMIVAAVMMPSVGWLGSHLGNRKLYLLSVGGFVSSSILCGMAWNVTSLITFRLVQAVCAGPMFPITQVILFQTFPENKRGLAMGVSSLGFSFGPMIGPILGGYLLEYASWRSVFYINVPVGVFCLILSYFILPKPEPQEPRRLDLPGMITMATFLVSFLLAMSQGREEGWNSSYILSLFSIAIVSGMGFIIVELKSHQPFVELHLYTNVAFAMASIVVALNTFSFMAINFIVILFLQIHLGLTPLQVAWMMMPSAVVIGILSVVSGRLSDIIPAKFLVISGLMLVSWCIWQYSAITSWTSLGMVTFWLTLRGFARGFTIAPLSAASLAPLHQDELRMGSALLSLNRGIAGSSSVALISTLFQNRVATRTIQLGQDQSMTIFGQEFMIQNLQTLFLRFGDVTPIAFTKAMVMMNRFVESEATLHSYHDIFVIIACLSAAGIIPALWMGKQHESDAATHDLVEPIAEDEHPSELPSLTPTPDGGSTHAASKSLPE